MDKRNLSRRKFIKYSGAAGATVLAGTTLSGCMGDGGAEVKNPNTIVDQQTGTIQSLDPAYVYDTRSGEILDNVYETLIDYKGTSTQEYKPVLAKKVPSKENGLISEDGLTYRFPIKEEVKFHNGNTLTPEDVEYTFERAMVQDRSGGPIWMLLEPLLGTTSTRGSDGNVVVSYDEIDSSVEVEGNEVVFNLDRVYPPFLQVICGSWSSIIDKQWAIEDQGAWPDTADTISEYNAPKAGDETLHSAMNGTGPYKLANWNKGSNLTMSSFDDYWREPAPVDNVLIETVEEFSTRLTNLKNGDADIIYVPTQKLNQVATELTEENVQGIKNVDVMGPQPSLQNDAIFMNFDISRQGQKDSIAPADQFDGKSIPSNFFADKDVRKGFAKSFDFDTYLNDVFKGYAIQPRSPVPVGIKYRNENVEKYSLNLQEAEEHFKNAHDGALWENGFQLEILYNSGNLQRQTAARILRDKVSSLNEDFSISIRGIKWADYLTQLTQYKLPLFIIGWLPDYPDPHNYVKPYMHSTGTFSAFQGYTKENVDELIEEGITTIDPEERRDIYYELQRIYKQDTPSFMLDQPQTFQVQRKWINGYYFNPIYPGEYYYSLTKG